MLWLTPDVNVNLGAYRTEHKEDEEEEKEEKEEEEEEEQEECGYYVHVRFVRSVCLRSK